MKRNQTIDHIEKKKNAAPASEIDDYSRIIKETKNYFIADKSTDQQNRNLKTFSI